MSPPFDPLARLLKQDVNPTGRNIERLLLAKTAANAGYVECSCSGRITYFIDIHGLQAGCNQCAFNIANLREAAP